VISVHEEHGCWDVTTRYSELTEFLQKLYEERSIELPSLPRKRLLSSTTPEVLINMHNICHSRVSPHLYLIARPSVKDERPLIPY